MSQIPLKTGFRIKHYTLLRHIENGSYGIVYLAKDEEQNQQVVIKECFPEAVIKRGEEGELIPHEEEVDYLNRQIERLIYEAELLASLDHPGIVGYRAHFKALNTAYLVLDFVEGEDFYDFQERRSLCDHELRQFMLQLADALSYMHDQKICHLDLKPTNILLNMQGDPVVIDFGGAWRQQELDDQVMSRLIYTPRYSPLENKSVEDVDPRSDLFSLGATLYRHISGFFPPHSLMRKRHLETFGKDPLVPAAVVGKQRYSQELLKAIDQALALDVAERPATLHLWLEQHPLGNQPSTPSPALFKSLKQADIDARSARYIEATRHYQDAANRKIPQALRGMACMLMEQEDSEKQSQSAILLHVKAGQMGDSAGYMEAAWLLGRYPSPDEAINQTFCYAKAAQQLHPIALYKHALLLLDKPKKSTDYRHGVSCLRQAAQMGHDKAQIKLAKLQMKRPLPAGSKESPYLWLLDAAEQKSSKAQLLLARCYEQGVAPHTTPNLEEAFYWYKRAANFEVTEAERITGLWYLEGRGTKPSRSRARFWLELAADKGDTEAQEALQRL
uniref:Putative Serine/threonine protein kinase with Sel1 repeat n=1 Tax=Magnetococcus massalia (strain MO-1) TaxID=451514 RepID=A0A1S7LNN1_MAGMO|nr:putative Serine/threonine protein kinase with Sel1 repeat [Candidatus Magnetococcus massalia]